MKEMWSRYASIPNSYHQKQVEQLREHGHTAADVVWCASEKVHGANFSLITNGVDIVAGSRTRILCETDQFFAGWQDVVQQEKARCLEAFRLLHRKYQRRIKCIVIYGELFGGSYSHSDKRYMPKSNKGIQDGVFYSPNLHFYAFDIKTDLGMTPKREESKSEDEQTETEEIDGRLTVQEAVGVFKKCGFLYSRILRKGTFDELMAAPLNPMQSTIPGLLGLPPPVDPSSGELIDNVAEGVVIRKWKSLDHSLIKIKSKAFWEMEDAARQKGARKQVLKFESEDFVNLVGGCVNERRFQATESKIGKLSAENAMQISKALRDDVLEELQQHDGNAMGGMDEKQIQKVKGLIAVMVRAFMKSKTDEL